MNITYSSDNAATRLMQKALTVLFEDRESEEHRELWFGVAEQRGDSFAMMVEDKTYGDTECFVLTIDEIHALAKPLVRYHYRKMAPTRREWQVLSAAITDLEEKKLDPRQMMYGFEGWCHFDWIRYDATRHVWSICAAYKDCCTIVFSLNATEIEELRTKRRG